MDIFGYISKITLYTAKFPSQSPVQTCEYTVRARTIVEAKTLALNPIAA